MTSARLCGVSSARCRRRMPTTCEATYHQHHDGDQGVGLRVAQELLPGELHEAGVARQVDHALRAQDVEQRPLEPEQARQREHEAGNPQPGVEHGVRRPDDEADQERGTNADEE